jgi:hypothetical protein
MFWPVEHRSCGFYSALIRKIGELEYPTIAVTKKTKTADQIRCII